MNDIKLALFWELRRARPWRPVVEDEQVPWAALAVAVALLLLAWVR